MEVVRPAAAAGASHGKAQQQQQQDLAQGPLTTHTERDAYARHMRQLFSPPDMLAPDGGINQEFFRPRMVVTLADRKWGEAERQLLYKGLAQLGVGRWRQMGEELLPGWDDTTLRLKAAKLLGAQNLSRYQGRKLGAAEVAAEFEANRQLGAATGCWKNGMLVDDDAGTLAAHWAAAQQQQQHQQTGGS